MSLAECKVLPQEESQLHPESHYAWPAHLSLWQQPFNDVCREQAKCFFLNARYKCTKGVKATARLSPPPLLSYTLTSSSPLFSLNSFVLLSLLHIFSLLLIPDDLHLLLSSNCLHLSSLPLFISSLLFSSESTVFLFFLFSPSSPHSLLSFLLSSLLSSMSNTYWIYNQQTQKGYIEIFIICHLSYKHNGSMMFRGTLFFM